MISDAFHYQEMPPLDAVMHCYFNAELQITALNRATWSFHVCFIAIFHIGDAAITACCRGSKWDINDETHQIFF